MRLILLLFFVVVFNHSNAGVIDWEGRYIGLSSGCEKNKKLKNGCRKNKDSCILVKNGAGGEVHLEIFVIQSNGHSCMINGVAKIIDNSIIYSAIGTEGEIWSVIIKKNDKKIVISQNGEGGISPFCGAHASLDGLQFLRDERKSDFGACAPK